MNFTGQNQDTLAGLYDFLYRKYSPVQGRWLTPDPAGLGAVNPGDPQTWNRYAYVRNSPLNRIDPQGLDDGGCDPDDPDCGGGPDPCDDGGCGGSGGGGGGPIININLGNQGPTVGFNGFSPCSGDSLGTPCAAPLPNPGDLLDLVVWPTALGATAQGPPLGTTPPPPCPYGICQWPPPLPPLPCPKELCAPPPPNCDSYNKALDKCDLETVACLNVAKYSPPIVAWGCAVNHAKCVGEAIADRPPGCHI